VAQFVRDHALSIVLAGLFLGSWIGHALFGWVAFAADQHSHDQTAQLFGSSGYIWDWLEATFENWQSEFLQLFTMVVLTAFLIHRGSSESRDSQEELRIAILHIEEQLEALRGEPAESHPQPKEGTKK
jgi:hypothetical protein